MNTKDFDWVEDLIKNYQELVKYCAKLESRRISKGPETCSEELTLKCQLSAAQNYLEFTNCCLSCIKVAYEEMLPELSESEESLINNFIERFKNNIINKEMNQNSIKLGNQNELLNSFFQGEMRSDSMNKEQFHCNKVKIGIDKYKISTEVNLEKDENVFKVEDNNLIEKMSINVKDKSIDSTNGKTLLNHSRKEEIDLLQENILLKKEIRNLNEILENQQSKINENNLNCVCSMKQTDSDLHNQLTDLYKLMKDQHLKVSVLEETSVKVALIMDEKMRLEKEVNSLNEKLSLQSLKMEELEENFSKLSSSNQIEKVFLTTETQTDDFSQQSEDNFQTKFYCLNSKLEEKMEENASLVFTLQKELTKNSELNNLIQTKEREVERTVDWCKDLTVQFESKVKKMREEHSDNEMVHRVKMRRVLSELDHLKLINSTYQAQLNALTESYNKIFTGDSSEMTE